MLTVSETGEGISISEISRSRAIFVATRATTSSRARRSGNLNFNLIRLEIAEILRARLCRRFSFGNDHVIRCDTNVRDIILIPFSPFSAYLTPAEKIDVDVREIRSDSRFGRSLQARREGKKRDSRAFDGTAVYRIFSRNALSLFCYLTRRPSIRPACARARYSVAKYSRSPEASSPTLSLVESP